MQITALWRGRIRIIIIAPRRGPMRPHLGRQRWRHIQILKNLIPSLITGLTAARRTHHCALKEEIRYKKKVLNHHRCVLPLDLVET